MPELPKKSNPYSLKSHRVAYQGKEKQYIVDELDLCGHLIEYGYLDKRGGVGILAINEKNEVVLVGQWRYPLQRYNWEIPAGGIDGDEEVLATAQRELLEEAGVTAEEWIYLGSMCPCSSHMSMEDHAFLARNLTLSEAHPEEDEQLESLWLPLEEVIELAQKGEIKEALTIFALFKAQAYLQNEE